MSRQSLIVTIFTDCHDSFLGLKILVHDSSAAAAIAVIAKIAKVAKIAKIVKIAKIDKFAKMDKIAKIAKMPRLTRLPRLPRFQELPRLARTPTQLRKYLIATNCIGTAVVCCTMAWQL